MASMTAAMPRRSRLDGPTRAGRLEGPPGGRRQLETVELHGRSPRRLAQEISTLP